MHIVRQWRNAATRRHHIHSRSKGPAGPAGLRRHHVLCHSFGHAMDLAKERDWQTEAEVVFDSGHRARVVYFRAQKARSNSTIAWSEQWMDSCSVMTRAGIVTYVGTLQNLFLHSTLVEGASNHFFEIQPPYSILT